MELTNEDVADILALLDSLPYDELDLQTSKFRLTLRRGTNGAWTQTGQVTTEPQAITEATADPADAAATAATAPTALDQDLRREPVPTAGGTARRSERQRASTGRGSGEHGRDPGGTEGPLPAQPDDTARTGGGSGGSKGGEAPLGNRESAGAGSGGSKGGEAPLGNTAPPGNTRVDISTSLPGTFYRAPRPGAAPFVEVGSEVHEDTVVAIVETMKLMNSVHAGTRGRVAEICVANGEPVTQGAVLLRIEPELT